MMRTEAEIREALARCTDVAGYGMSLGPCPMNTDGEPGCCAECSAPSTLLWVLGEGDHPTANAQDLLVAALRGAGGEEDDDDEDE